MRLRRPSPRSPGRPIEVYLPNELTIDADEDEHLVMGEHHLEDERGVMVAVQ